jgi:hypothetical protein
MLIVFQSSLRRTIIMTKKKSALINESVARRWGKLANMPSLTENWLETLNEEDPAEEEAEAMDDMEKAALGDDPEAEMDYAEGDLERADDAEAGDLAGVLETDEAQALVAGIASQVADMLGVDVDIETDGEAEEVEDVVDMDVEIEEPAMGDDPAMAMHPRNRDDELEEDLHERDMNKAGKKDDDTEDESLGMRDGAESTKKQSMKDRRKESRGAKNEELDLEVIDDEALTEAVLKRVVERLLNRK